MKLYCVFIFLLFFFSFIDGHSQEILLAAHEAYQTKDYQKALELYQKISSKGPMTWYALAHCALEMKDYTRSLLYFKRSMVSASPALLRVINADLSSLYNYFPHAKEDSLSKLGYRALQISSFVSLLSWQIVILVLLFLIGIIIIMRPKKYMSFLIILAIVFIGSAFLLLHRYFVFNNSRAMVIKESQNVFVQPDFNAPSLKNLFNGQEVNIQEERGEWFRVKHHQQVGWVPKESVEYVTAI